MIMVFLSSIIIVVFLDSVFLPAFLNFQISSITSLCLIALILFRGINKKNIWLVSAMAFIVEVVFKYQPGTYIISFLIVMLVIFLISRFFNLPFSKHAKISINTGLALSAPFLNYLLFFIFIVISEYIQGNYSLSVLPYSPTKPAFLVFYSIETFLILYLFKFLDKKNIIYV